MIPQYSHNLLASFYLWAENRVLNNTQAYFNLTTQLYPTYDPSLPSGLHGYSAPFKQWIYDSGVAGAWIINSVSGGGFSAPLTRASGVHFDYINGRIIVPASFGSNLALTGSMAIRELNTYLVNETEDQILTQNKYFLNPRYNGTPTSGIAPNVMATPAIFINSLSDTVDPYEFGG